MDQNSAGAGQISIQEWAVYRLTCVQSAFQVFPERLVPPAIASNANHCVLAARKAPRQQNTIALREGVSHQQ